jgi:DNA polymerase-1
MPKRDPSLFDAVDRPPVLMIIDGHVMVYRAWFALHQQTMTLRSTGQEVKGIYGFTTMFIKALADRQPTHVAIAFDTPEPTFRQEQFEQYKAQRPKLPPEFHQQVEWAKRLMHVFRVPTYEQSGLEADDLIGSLCAKATEQGIETVVVTGDGDMLQLVSPHVRVVLQHGIQAVKVYDERAFRERYSGLEPSQQPDVKALQGDPSDNIPGVPGIGVKGAVKLIQEFGSIEGLYEHLDDVQPPRIQGLLRDNEEAARQFKHLTTIIKDAPLELDLEASRFWQFDREEVLALFHELEFNSLIDRIPMPGDGSEHGANGAGAPTIAATTSAPPTDTTVVDNRQALEAMVTEIKAASALSFDTESTSTNPMEAELVGLSFAVTPGKSYYVPVGHRSGTQLPLEVVLAQVRPLMEDAAIAKVAHNANYDLTLLANYGVNPMSVTMGFDTMLAAHLVGDKAIGLKAQAFQRLQVEMTPIKELIGTGRKKITFDAVEIAEAAPYAAADADMTLRLKKLLEGELEKAGLTRTFAEDEMPLVPVLVQMQVNGITLDTEMLQSMGTELGDEIARLEGEAYNSVGHRFGLNSPKQLGDLLFTDLKLTKGKRTQTGYSTDAATLESLRNEHPVVSLVLEYRALTKLKSTYVDTLPELVNPKTGRVHTSYNQAGSATGRISSNDPNLQNIPVRTELGRRVRKGFVAPGPDWLLLAADYSQIELRVLAHLSQDPELIAAFERDEDIHAATASSIYGVALDEVNADMRRLAKVMNFGVIYGLSAFGIAQQTELSMEEGAAFIDSYFGTYSKVRGYLDETIVAARDLGYAETLHGRRRYLPELRSSNMHHRQAAERMAVNAPVQGTAAEIIKAAMVQLQARMDAGRMQSRMLLQVHDELIFESPKDEMETLKKLVLEIMPHALDLSVPLKVDLKSGRTWGDME